MNGLEAAEATAHPLSKAETFVKTCLAFPQYACTPLIAIVV